MEFEHRDMKNIVGNDGKFTYKNEHKSEWERIAEFILTADKTKFQFYLSFMNLGLINQSSSIKNKTSYKSRSNKAKSNYVKESKNDTESSSSKPKTGSETPVAKKDDVMPSFSKFKKPAPGVSSNRLFLHIFILQTPHSRPLGHPKALPNLTCSK